MIGQPHYSSATVRQSVDIVPYNRDCLYADFGGDLQRVSWRLALPQYLSRIRPENILYISSLAEHDKL